MVFSNLVLSAQNSRQNLTMVTATREFASRPTLSLWHRYEPVLPDVFANRTPRRGSDLMVAAGLRVIRWGSPFVDMEPSDGEFRLRVASPRPGWAQHAMTFILAPRPPPPPGTPT